MWGEEGDVHLPLFQNNFLTIRVKLNILNREF